MNREYAQLLFDYNRWANGLIFAKAAEVSSEDYMAEAEGLSFGSLHGTIRHLLGAERGWVRRWQGEAPEQLSEEATPDLASLRTVWLQEVERQEAYLNGLSDEAVAAPFEFQLRDGRGGSYPLWQMVAHVVNHGTQFRSEADAAGCITRGPRPVDLHVPAGFGVNQVAAFEARRGRGSGGFRSRLDRVDLAPGVEASLESGCLESHCS